MTIQEDALRDYRDRTHRKALTKVGNRIYHFAGYAHSNITAIIGDSSVIVVDAADSPSSAEGVREELARITDKPVRTLIYTHGHPDHRGGAGAFRDTLEEVIAFTSLRRPLPYMARINERLMKRGIYQFGHKLNEGELITQGLGPREKLTGGEHYDFVEPTTVYTEDRIDRIIDGVSLSLIRVPGETDDQIAVWLAEDGALCCGDTYYSCWPNVYAIRGTAYRDVCDWIDSLSRLIELSAAALLPGHHQAVLGKETINDTLTAYRDALQSVLDQTLDCINRGMSEDLAAETVHLPDSLAEKPFLGEFYGTVAFAVRAIYSGYVGWFDGGPVHLLPSAQEHYNKELVQLIGKDRLVERIDRAIKEEDYQLGLELCALLEGEDERRKACLRGRATQTTSSNARNYLLSWAKFGR